MAAVHLTEKQASLLFGEEGARPARKGGKRGSQARKKKEDLPENIVESGIVGFLQSRGWYVSRLHVGTYVPLGRLMGPLESSGIVTKDQVMRNIVRIGQKGSTDFWAVRPAPGQTRLYHFLFFEVKGPRSRPKPEQMEWMKGRAACGFEAKWFDCLEDDGFDTSFLNYYKERYPGEVLHG